MEYEQRNIDSELMPLIEEWCEETLPIGSGARNPPWGGTWLIVYSLNIIRFRYEEHYAWFLLKWGDQI